MSFSERDLRSIEDAIASGTLKVRYADREVWYQTTADLLKARETIRIGLGKSRSRRIAATYCKGLDDESH